MVTEQGTTLTSILYLQINEGLSFNDLCLIFSKDDVEGIRMYSGRRRIIFCMIYFSMSGLLPTPGLPQGVWAASVVVYIQIQFLLVHCMCAQ